MLSMPRIVRPDPHRFRGRNLVPPLDRPLADPLSETKNWRNLLTGRRGSQVSHSLPAHLERFIGDEEVTDSRLGLNETWTCRITFNLLAKVGDINAGILAVLFRFRSPDFAKDVAMREDATRMPDEQSKQSILRGREFDLAALFNSYFRFPSSLGRRSEKSQRRLLIRKSFS
jgi:ORF6N domain